MTFHELIDLLKNTGDVEILNSKSEEIAELIPKVRIMFNYDQKNDYHPNHLWLHCLYVVANLPRGIDDDMLYLAALLHDIGKPDCQIAGTRYGDKNMHYFGHPKRGKQIVRDEVLPDLFSKGVDILFDDYRRLLYYIEHHDDYVVLKASYIKKHLECASFYEFQHLMLLGAADALAHTMKPDVKERYDNCMLMAGEFGENLYRNQVQYL